MKQAVWRQRARVGILLAVWLSLLAGAAVPSALAEGQMVPQVPSADASEEIVYVDNNGVIRVQDLAYNTKQVQWYSPTAGWRSIALGDFDADGDFEIAAVRGALNSAVAPELAVFDPVVATGAPSQGQEINGVPWKQLFTLPLPGNPTLVFAGNFDTNVPGDEIAVSRALVPADGGGTRKTRVTVYKQTSATPTGTAWVEHVSRNFDQEWNRGAVGNLDLAGAQELVLLDEDKGEFNVYRPDDALRKIDGPGGSDSNPMRDVAVGQFIRGGYPELLVARKEDSTAQRTFEIYQYNGSIMVAVTGDRLAPGPRVIVAGDISGSNEDAEAIMVRRCEGNCARLIVRNDGSDGIVQGFLDGLRLDDDDGFRAVAAGDIDGDGRDEIVAMRDNQIRYFPDAHNSTSHQTINVPTDRRNLLIGDLDRNGFISGPVLGATPGRIDETVYMGFVREGSIRLQNTTTDDLIAYQAASGYSWLTVSPPTGFIPGKSGSPLEMTYRIDASTLTAGRVYTDAKIILSSSTPNVVNVPFSIPMTVTVAMPPFGAIPDEVTAFYYPCTEPLAEQQLTVTVAGTPGTAFTAVVLPPPLAAQAVQLRDRFLVGELTEEGVLLQDREGRGMVLPTELVTASPAESPAASPAGADSFDWPSQTPWVTAVTSAFDTVPTSLTLTISPTLRTKEIEQTSLFLRGTDPLNPSDFVYSNQTIRLVCPSRGVWLPVIER